MPARPAADPPAAGGKPPPARPVVLELHRARVAVFKAAMDRLRTLHEQAYDLGERLLYLYHGNAPDRVQQMEWLDGELLALADSIATLREGTFGSITREARLMLSSTVESIPPALLNEPEPLGGR